MRPFLKKIIFFALLFLIFYSASALAGEIQYIGKDKNGPVISVNFSRDKGQSWENKLVKPGQIFSWPPDTTTLVIDSVEYDPKLRYKVRNGSIIKSK